jgi:hypothetical protein
MLPASWVDALLNRLTVRYGAAFMRHYTSANVSFDDLRADWAQVLGTCTAGQIAFGLASLDPDRAPNAAQFRALCKAMPGVDLPALPAPNPSGLRRMAEVLAPLKRNGITFEELLAHHRGRRDRGEPMSPAQRDWLKAAEAKVGGVERDQVLNQCNPIPDSLLPPGMRDGGIARDFATELVAQHDAGQFVDPVRLNAARAVLAKHAGKSRAGALLEAAE